MNEETNESNKLSDQGMKQAIEVLNSEPIVEAAYLFGSQAEGRVSSHSDIDIAVLFSSSLTDRQRVAVGQELFRKLFHAFKRSDIDIVDLSRANLLLRHRIFKTGLVIKGKNSSRRVDYQRDSTIEYLDTIPLRVELRSGTRHMLEEGRFGRSRKS